MVEIDEAFKNLYIKEEFLKESDKMPEKIKLFIKKGKEIEDKLVRNENVCSLIYDCINIENSIKSIKYIKEHLIGNNIDKNKNQKFITEDNRFNYLSKKIKTLSRIFYPLFKFRKCPENIEYNRKYNIIGEDCNIVTRNNSNKKKTKREYIGIICENELERDKVYLWRIKVLFSYCKEDIIVGVAPSQFVINSSMYDDCDCGWYFTWNGKKKYIQENKENLKKKKDSESDEDSSSEEVKREKKKRIIKKYKDKEQKKKKKYSDSDSEDEIDSISEYEKKKKISSENENESLSDIEDENEIILEMNMKEKKLKIIKKNKTIDEISNIEVNEGIYPAVFLGNFNDLVKIENIFLK